MDKHNGNNEELDQVENNSNEVKMEVSYSLSVDQKFEK